MVATGNSVFAYPFLFNAIVELKLMYFYPMKKLILVSIFLAIGLQAQAQKVFRTSYKSQADKVVYVTEYKSQADLIVYETKYQSQAKPYSGIWYWTDYKSQADWEVYFTKYKSQAGFQ